MEDEDGASDGDGDDIDEDEELHGDLGGLENFLSSLSV